MDFLLEGSEEKITVFTTRVDTIYGSTCVILAPEHELVSRFGFEKQAERMIRARATGNPADVEKEGVDTGRYAINPYNGERVPIWIGNFVLMEYGSGAIMAVPAHDQRDFEFCRKYGIPIRPVIRPVDGPLADEPTMEEAFEGYGVVENSPPFSGLASEEAKEKMNAWAKERAFGEAAVTYRLRDWGISRQRYWGTPIPMIYCPQCGVLPVPENRLPVLLPANVKLTGTGQSPLRNVPEFVNVDCPNAAAGRNASATRWTRLSTRRGISIATAIRKTSGRPTTPRRSPPGFRSTNTSAASSTPSCTWSTRAFSRR